MVDETPRSRRARAAAERALVRVVHHYGRRPEFVLLGGLVPELLCADSTYQHAGTTDIDVQVNLEIACGLSANFADPAAQGRGAYARQMLLGHPELERKALLRGAPWQPLPPSDSQ